MSIRKGYISWSELNTFRRCPHEWYIAYIENISVPRVGGAANLGTEWHVLMERWFKGQQEGTRPKDLVAGLGEQVKAELDFERGNTQSQERLKAISTLSWMWQGWLDHGHREWIGWTVHRLETSEYVPLDARFRVKVKKDMLASDPKGRTWVIDHKSTSKFLKPDGIDLSFDDQGGLYLLSEVVSGFKPRGALWAYAVTADTKAGREPHERFWTVMQNRTATEIENIRLEAVADCERMAQIASLAEATRRPDKEYCRWKCDFRAACLASRRGELRDEIQGILDMGGQRYVPPVRPEATEGVDAGLEPLRATEANEDTTEATSSAQPA